MAFFHYSQMSQFQMSRGFGTQLYKLTSIMQLAMQCKLDQIRLKPCSFYWLG